MAGSNKADWDKFKKLLQLTVEDQANTFLRAFVLDFVGKFQEIFDICDEFKKYAPKTGVVRELNEIEAHYFLEKRDETASATELREYLKEIDLDKNHSVSFIEYLLWKYQKTLKLLFSPGLVPPEVLAALDQAIADYKAVVAKRKAREDKMAELEATAALGGVKGLAAQHQLAEMKDQLDKLDENRREVKAEVNKKKAQKAVEKEEAVNKARREAAAKEEEERVEREKREKEEAERRKKEEARARLKAKASQFEEKK